MSEPREPRFEKAASGQLHRFRMTLGALTIVTDLRREEIAQTGDVFSLSCSSGRIPDQSATREELTFEKGCVVVDFARLCPASTYTLRARLASGSEETLFEDVPYRELTGLSESIDEEAIEPW